jgi:hypothetical protein
LQEFGFIGSTPNGLWPELAAYWDSLWRYSSAYQYDWTPGSYDMVSQIYRVQNDSSQTVQVTILSPAITQSYDLVIEPQKGVTYRDVLPSNAPLPAPVSGEEFKLHRVRLRVGQNLHALYQYKGVTRLTQGDVSAEDAPPIPGYSGGGALVITVAADATISAKHVPYISGPTLAVAAWAVDRFAGYGLGPDGLVAEKVCKLWDWQPWSDEGAPTVPLTGPMAAVSWVTGRYGIYTLDKNGGIWERAWAGTSWSAWTLIEAPKGVRAGRSHRGLVDRGPICHLRCRHER